MWCRGGPLRPRPDLAATAYGQLLQYREALDNPPLLVVCDLDCFEIHTNFTNTPTVVYRFTLADLLADSQEPLRILRALMEHPEELRPGKTRDDITAEAARQFASLAERLRGRGHEPQEVAHFLNKLLFCMFAEDAGLLPPGLLRRLTAAARNEGILYTHFENRRAILLAALDAGPQSRSTVRADLGQRWISRF